MENKSNLINKVNEGPASYVVSQGVHAAVSPMDSPVPVNLPRAVSSATGHVSGTYNHYSWGGININIDKHRITNYFGGSHGRGAADGLLWFSAHLKEIAIVAAGAALIAAIAKLIKSMNKSIKVRYNKVVKTLQKAQLAFVTKPEGLDMKAVMPGVGSRIADFAARFWTMNFNNKRFDATKKYNIGLYPFCDRYIEEIGKDYRCAVDAFNKIALTEDKDAIAAPEKKEESFDVVYNSFHEAYDTDLIVEGKLNEQILPIIIGAGLGLAKIAAGAGLFKVPKLGKDGKATNEMQAVKVTKESVREICYAIIFNYMDKYVNMEQVFKSLGIDSKSLADLDASSVDKLKSMLEKYAKPEKNVYNKQYNRLYDAYKNMLGHYYKIGDGIITNFEKYTKADDEKHANLLISAKEKLQNMWDAQKDLFDNNFSHVLIEIVSNPVYMGYLSFILEDVMPVFKSGLAGDADYVLDITPQKDQYYLIRQTEKQGFLKSDTEGGERETGEGNFAIAKVNSFDQTTKKIKFTLICRYAGTYNLSENGVVSIGNYDAEKFDYDAYKDKGEIELDYAKWMSLDPWIMDWKENEEYEGYSRRYLGKDGKVSTKSSDQASEELVYFTRDLSKTKQSETENSMKLYDTAIVGVYNFERKAFTNAYKIKFASPIQGKDIDEIMSRKNENPELNMNFVKNNWKENDFYLLDMEKKEEVNVKDAQEFVKFINGITIPEEQAKKTSLLYTREFTEGGRDTIEYAYARLSGDLESVNVGDYQRLNDGKINEDESEDEKDVVKPDDKGADQNIVTGIYVASIKKGTDLSDKSASEFSGSLVKINPACSVKDVKDKLEGLGFKPDYDDSRKKKEYIFNNIISNKGSRLAQLSDEYDINKIEDAIKLVRERKNPAEQLIGKVGEISKKIVEAVQGLGLAAPADYEAAPVMMTSGAQFINRANDKFEYFRAKPQKTNKMGYIEVDTDVDFENGNDIKFLVYPILISSKPSMDKNVPADAKPGVIIAFEEDKNIYFQSSDLDETELREKAVPKLITEMVQRKHMEDSRFSLEVKNDEGSEISYQEIKLCESLIQKNVVLKIDNGAVSYSVNGNVAEGNISIANNNDGSVKVIIKYGENGSKAIAFNIVAQATKAGVVTKFVTDKGDVCAISKPLDKAQLERYIGLVIKSVTGISPKDASGNPMQSPEKEVAQQQQAPSATQSQAQPQDSSIAQPAPQPEQKNQQGEPQNSSYKVSYSVKSKVFESNSSTVTIDRTLNKELKGYFVLSESVYDDGNAGRLMLESDEFRRLMRTKSEVMKFVKSHSSVALKEARKVQTYTVDSPYGNVPSAATPLLESVMLIKFGVDGKIEDKIYIGKNVVK